MLILLSTLSRDLDILSVQCLLFLQAKSQPRVLGRLNWHRTVSVSLIQVVGLDSFVGTDAGQGSAAHTRT